MEFHEFKMRNIVFSYGKLDDKMYIILEGMVNILCPKYVKIQSECSPKEISFDINKDK
jgi:hypothetical protein